MEIRAKAFKEILKILSLLKSEQITYSIVEEKQYNFESTVTINKSKLKVQVYFGKKGVKTVIQGDQNSSEYKLLNQLISAEPVFEFSKQKVDEPNNYIGSDEAGKGDFFGPLVTAAVFTNKETQQKLKDVGVKDSKKLNDNQIGDLAEKIIHLIGNNYEVVQINPSKYNEMYAKFKNLNKLLIWSHSTAVEKLLAKVKCNNVITDKFSNRDLRISTDIDISNIEFIQETGAEKYVGVAAASILARNHFNIWFLQQAQKGLNLPKGSSIIVKEKVKSLQKAKHVELVSIAKMHFKLEK